MSDVFFFSLTSSGINSPSAAGEAAAWLPDSPWTGYNERELIPLLPLPFS